MVSFSAPTSLHKSLPTLVDWYSQVFLTSLEKRALSDLLGYLESRMHMDIWYISISTNSVFLYTIRMHINIYISHYKSSYLKEGWKYFYIFITFQLIPDNQRANIYHLIYPKKSFILIPALGKHLLFCHPGIHYIINLLIALLTLNSLHFYFLRRVFWNSNTLLLIIQQSLE